MKTIQSSSTTPNNLATEERKGSILIVDDERALRMVLRRAMEGEGYQTVDVSSGEQCLSLCQKQ
jgi:CheY-like chemotaxis protein